jgi:outer membrane immunogenic protein
LIFEGRIMKKLATLGAAIAATCLIHSANAADLPAKAPIYKAPMAPVAAPYSWTGIYLGINGGAAWAKEDWLDNTAGFGAGGPVSFDPNGGVFGGQVGFRWQWNQLVFGVEGTWDWASISQSVTGAPYTDELKIKSIYTATGQIGWAFDRVLIYGKGGWAGAKVDANVTTSPDFGGASNSQSVHGWTAGGGVDFAIWQGLVIGAEYDHFDFSYGAFTAPWSTGGAPWVVTNTSRLTADQVVARLSYQFNWMH